jgi:hypothetical protein
MPRPLAYPSLKGMQVHCRGAASFLWVRCVLLWHQATFVDPEVVEYLHDFRRRPAADRAWRILGHAGVGVPEQFLHLEQAHAALHEPGRLGVPEGVRRRPPIALDEIRRVHSSRPLRRSRSSSAP